MWSQKPNQERWGRRGSPLSPVVEGNPYAPLSKEHDLSDWEEDSEEEDQGLPDHVSSVSPEQWSRLSDNLPGADGTGWDWDIEDGTPEEPPRCTSLSQSIRKDLVDEVMFAEPHIKLIDLDLLTFYLS